MRLDFDFHGGAGYAVAHRTLSVDLPQNYEFSFRVRGDAPRNNVEFKLIDASGENVWWVNRRDYMFPQRFTLFTVKKRQISFAWGPLGGGEISHVAAMELSVTAGSGGKGSVWIEDLELTQLPPVPTVPPTPRASASTSVRGASATMVLDSKSETEWRSTSDSTQWLSLALGGEREYGGLTVAWDRADYARDYDVETSDDGVTWATAYRVRGGHGGLQQIYMPDSESRWVRLLMLRSSRGRGYAVREVSVHSLSWSETRNAFDFAVARAAARGDYPRAFTDSVQTYWTVIGAPAGERQALVGEDGAVEVGKGMFSLEPFLFDTGHLITWTDATETQTLARGYLPIPSVVWEPNADKSLRLLVTAWVSGSGSSTMLLVRYRVTNTTSTTRRPVLFLTLRPFQVNGPFQFLNTPGGAAAIRSLSYDGRVVHVDGDGEDTAQVVIPITRASRFGASTLDRGGVLAALRKGHAPSTPQASDSLGSTDGALEYDLDVPAHESRDVFVAAPFGQQSLSRLSSDYDGHAAASDLARNESEWESRTRAVAVHVPPVADRIARTLRTMQAYILINQLGPAIRPGSRAYARTWIRDGALISEALLRTGHAEDVRRFIEWYARFQFASGKVPCCVDQRGADPVPEHDSDGEFIYLIREYYRYTGDSATLTRMWPHVDRAVAYLDSLRMSERPAAYATRALQSYYGILPPSISHEGYSAKPMHSYWDDFWALRGFRDAAAIAVALGKRGSARHIDSVAVQFQGDLLASISISMISHGISFIPGSADLGDFDPTSTTIALDPGGELDALPRAAVDSTFDRYWREHETRVSHATWNDYTPYELRVVGAFLRLGRPERAHQLLEFLLEGQRPDAWNEWAEVVGRQPRAPRFIGDMPHTWVGSDFMRSFLDMFAYDDEAHSAVVIGAGIPVAWARAAGGVSISRLRTPYGLLDMSERLEGRIIRIRLGGSAAPTGGFVVRQPFPAQAIRAVVNGVTIAPTRDGSVQLRALPATIDFVYPE